MELASQNIFSLVIIFVKLEIYKIDNLFNEFLSRYLEWNYYFMEKVFSARLFNAMKSTNIYQH